MCKTVKECIYLFGDLFIEPTTPQGSQLLLIRLFSMGSTFRFLLLLFICIYDEMNCNLMICYLQASCRYLLQPSLSLQGKKHIGVR